MGDRDRLRTLFPEFIWISASFSKILEQVVKFAETEIPVLILGETGVGKDLVARALHRLGPRRLGPFIASNIAGIPKTLVEAQLFGHQKGAFTGAVQARRGFLQLSNGGTFFLDEVGDMPRGVQVKLLRVLEDSVFYRLGGERPIKTDVRFVSATNRVLSELLHDGRFREDLYYRLSVGTITIPALRARPEDIRPLVMHYVPYFAEKHRRPPLLVAEDALVALTEQHWPGNVRQLVHVLERIVILTERTDRGLGRHDVDAALATEDGNCRVGEPAFTDKTLRDIARETIEGRLRRYRGNHRLTYESLGIPRSTFYRMLARYRIRDGLSRFDPSVRSV